ncbi:MAG: hypothetical protein ABI885_25680 [Gammaproteobacteria bacterium]
MNTRTESISLSAHLRDAETGASPWRERVVNGLALLVLLSLCLV